MLIPPSYTMKDRPTHQSDKIDDDQSEKKNDGKQEAKAEEVGIENEKIDGDDWMENNDGDGDSEEVEEENMRIECYYCEKEGDYWIYRREGIKGLDIPSFCSYGPISTHDPFKWQAGINGPPGSPYEDGVFFLTIDLPSDYPISPPSIVFNTKVFHPNIDEDGKIYMSILEKEEWTPIYTISLLLGSIYSLLAEPDPVDHTFESCHLFKCDRESYIKKAKEWTRIHAMQ